VDGFGAFLGHAPADAGTHAGTAELLIVEMARRLTQRAVFDPPRLHQTITRENRPPGRFFLGSEFPRTPAVSLFACAKNVLEVPTH
jgi:hypothetical protein